jgi:multiple sugar transport system substrate-binding protein
VPEAQLVKEGWAAPLDLSDKAMANLKGALLDGIHIFDGKVYAFPIFDYHVYTNVTWFNRKIAERAGLDPANAPTSYDEFRAAARAVQSKGRASGWTWNIGMPIRTSDQVHYLAQAAGFEGLAGQLFRTGEFAYDHDAYVTALEFLLSLKRDGVLTPGSESWVDTDARGRWAAGTACYYFDGPWCPGVVLLDNPGFADSLGVGPILTPEPGATVRTYHGPQVGDYWLTPGSKHAAAANQLLSDYFATPEYSVEVANTMSQPPRDLDAVENSKAHPEYKKLVGWYRSTVFLAPTAAVKNVEVTKALAESKPVQPNLGTIVQGAFTGDVKDVRKALKKLTDDSAAERERAVKAAQAKGAQVSLDDYAFPDWRPGADYTLDMYK